MRPCLGFIFSSLLSFSALASDLDWSGLYRVEANYIRNAALSGGGDKSYILHHLILRPKIVASDGFIIYSRFDLLNADAPFNNSQLGQAFGSGIGNADPTTTTGADDSSVLSSRQKSEQLQITQLYLNYVNEFGSLIVGRAPLNFGLGMSYNSGEGWFDHWLETRDLISYKIVFGNISITPMMARVSQRGFEFENAMEYNIQAQYENPETDVAMGVMYSTRNAGPSTNDAPVSKTSDGNGVLGGNGASATLGGYNRQLLNLFVLKDTERYRIGFEGAFLSGKTGVTSAGGSGVSYSGYGLAMEGEWRPEDSRMKLGARAGYATGDSPSTTDRFEGFIFNRNYDVAFIMFNHPLGKADFLRTTLGGSRAAQAGVAPATVDTESISNVFYLAPYIDYRLSDRFDFKGVLATGWLAADPLIGGSGKKDLGYEFDFAFNYKVKGNMVWSNTIGLLFPGGAFAGDQDYGRSFCYGFQSRAAVRF